MVTVNPLKNNPVMPWGDAAVIASVLTVGSFFSVYLTMWEWPMITGQILPFCYSALRFFGAQWFTNFIMLTGLGKYVERKRRSNNNP